MEGKRDVQSAKRAGGLGFLLSLPILSWALYDFANTIFSSNITTVFFPFYVTDAIGNTEEMQQLGNTLIAYANALASFFLVIFSPLFGVWIDQTGRKQRYIVRFAGISIVCTIFMGVFAGWESDRLLFGLPIPFIATVLVFVLAKFFYNSSLVFYDAKISDLVPRERLSTLSGFGVAVGYIGTLVGLLVYFLMDYGYAYVFLATAGLYLIFSLPLFFFLKDKQPKQKCTRVSIWRGYKEIITTFKEISKHRSIFRFMMAYFFVNDAIATTIAVMSVYAVSVVGFSSGQFILLYLVSTVTAIIGSFCFGQIANKIGAHRSFSVVALVMIIALTIGALATAQWMFWIAGGLFGIALGSIWVTSRTLIVDLSPAEKQGQFFGLFAFSGKVSSIIGPVIYGSITLVLKDFGDLASRLALTSLILLTIIGLVVHVTTKQRTDWTEAR
ncbi:MFS transporter, UMF1 family [Terribacillus aidingensis]|uniref:MFS transporter, UMF1 family n=1 Tax=Terribacillus aidingensis TaxID=586416 RepID=A0A285N2P1_9BACI|nr:MFS transporter [Terribacillus aidingensis]SNZ03700.1 MFS transporter, UMF1 family [Terribacillus aidingensis]